MDEVSLFEALNIDPRPSFVVKLDTDSSQGQLNVAFSNPALKRDRYLLDAILADDVASARFQKGDDVSFTQTLGSTEWLAYTIRNTWRVVQTIAVPKDTINTNGNGSSTKLQANVGSFRAAEEMVEGISIDKAGKLHILEDLHLEEDCATVMWEPQNNGVKEPDQNLADQQVHVPEQVVSKAENENAALVRKLASSISARTAISARLQRMLRIMELSEIAVYDFDPSGKLIQANAAYFSMTGHPQDSWGDMSFVDCIYPEDLPMVMEHWNALCRGTPVTFELRWKPKMDFSSTPPSMLAPKWAFAAAVPDVDENGDVKTISGCMTDIDAQKRRQEDAIKRAEALERARASEQRFEKFAEFAPVSMYTTDPNMKLTYCNPEWFRQIDHPVVPYEDIDWHNLVFEEDAMLAAVVMGKLHETGQPVTFEYRIKKTWTSDDGVTSPRWCLTSVFPELNIDGSIKAIMGMSIDISHIKSAEQMQARRVEEATEVRRQQLNFIDMTSHEIRNPLGAVVHCADSIMSSLTDMRVLVSEACTRLTNAEQSQLQESFESSIEAVNTIMSCSMHQKRIVDDILTLSKLDSSLLQITPSLVETSNIRERVLQIFEVDADQAGVQLRIVQEESMNQISKHVMLDLGRLLQVLVNLITNAIKFTQQESNRSVTVSMGASLTRPSKSELSVDLIPASTIRDCMDNNPEWGTGKFFYLYFKVRDTGCGMTPDEVAKIFRRFSQGSPRTHTKYGGSGLGLFISRELTELQGGEIGVCSEPGVGSTFAFFVKAGEAHSSGRDPAPLLSTSRRAADCRSSETKYSILVVEDNIINQQVLSKQLRKLGHEVHVANHGVEAIDFIGNSKYWKDLGSTGTELNVILMDLEMPIMDGLTCTRKIREMQKTGDLRDHLPIIAVSANARKEQVEEAMAAGVDDSIAKPFRIADLVPKIARLVAGGNVHACARRHNKSQPKSRLTWRRESTGG